MALLGHVFSVVWLRCWYATRRRVPLGGPTSVLAAGGS